MVFTTQYTCDSVADYKELLARADKWLAGIKDGACLLE